nr:PREDICTED: uncharacterized protein LOC657996 [Tribolium castaneum]|eukprot:XP_969508.2 PREDICTED: uncharacterized protein LOC657996 [Tribolium castaneum]
MLFIIFIIIFLCTIIKIYLTLTIVRCKSQTCLVGKTALITGANTGIGYEIALDFAKRGARVILACRNEQKAREACRKIINETGNENVVVKFIDLSSFASVRAFVEDVKRSEDRLNILVNNAAILEVGLNSLTIDGNLLVMQVNYFSPFLLTVLLTDLMRKSKPSRIINLTSVMARVAHGFNVDKINNVEGTLNDYGITKLCMILFTLELAKRLDKSGVTAYSADPGLVDTEIFKQTPRFINLLAQSFKRFFFKTPEEGAQTPIHCSVTKGIEECNGENFIDCQRVKKYAIVENQELTKFWNITEMIVSLKPDEICTKLQINEKFVTINKDKSEDNDKTSISDDYTITSKLCFRQFLFLNKMFYIFVIVFLLIFGVILKIYIKFTTGWCRSKTCLVGKTAIITGANTGIGFETALDFAKRGARVILACRDEKRAEDARYKVIEETGNKNVVVKLINMSSFNSVREFAKEINETEDRLDILVNNAGAGGIGDKKSKDGHVLLMQINYFSSFLLTHLLIGLLKKTKGSRVINVSSMVAKYAKNFDVSNVDKYPGIVTVYYYSKLCNILFTKELARRLEGTEVTTYSLHPGAVKTELYRHAKNGYKLLFQFLTNIFFKTSEEGAQTTIYCSVTKRIEKYSGEHFEDCQKVASYKTVADPDLPKKLWEFTQDIVQLKPDEILT